MLIFESKTDKAREAYRELQSLLAKKQKRIDKLMGVIESAIAESELNERIERINRTKAQLDDKAFTPSFVLQTVEHMDSKNYRDADRVVMPTYLGDLIFERKRR
mgnify:CR=1 FL=1